ncbi:hypothetical protein DPV78_000580 [Talaromyces pinophilus]|nr:hypothetical protein DPV78_000580 [Talaromyces pinophilus]
MNSSRNGGLQNQFARTPVEWHKLLAKRGLEKSTIHTVDLASASKIGLDQFLLLRVLWKKDEKRKDVINFIARRTRGRLLQQVQSKMRDTHLSTPTTKSTSFPENRSASESDNEDIATPPRAETPVPQELVNVMYPPTKDEQIVNTALIVLLNVLTIHLESFSSKWTLHRKTFIAAFGDAEFEARTDGYLNDHRDNPSIIVEVKPVMRSTKLSAIRMQENAQMVAWIKSDDCETQRNCMIRVHISQDRDQIFVNVAKHDEGYLNHMNNTQSTKPSVLTMDTLNAAHMRELGPILLAISLRADYESKQR